MVSLERNAREQEAMRAALALLPVAAGVVLGSRACSVFQVTSRRSPPAGRLGLFGGPPAKSSALFAPVARDSYPRVEAPWSAGNPGHRN